MALYSSTFTGAGTTGPYAVPFPYLSQSHVHVFVDDVEVTFTWLTSSTIQLSAPAANGAQGIIRRITPSAVPLVDWADGANLNEDNLDLQTRQLLYILQEQEEAAAAAATAAAQEVGLAIIDAAAEQAAQIVEAPAATFAWLQHR